MQDIHKAANTQRQCKRMTLPLASPAVMVAGLKFSVCKAHRLKWEGTPSVPWWLRGQWCSVTALLVRAQEVILAGKRGLPLTEGYLPVRVLHRCVPCHTAARCPQLPA